MPIMAMTTTATAKREVVVDNNKKDKHEPLRRPLSGRLPIVVQVFLSTCCPFACRSNQSSIKLCKMVKRKDQQKHAKRFGQKDKRERDNTISHPRLRRHPSH
ncbi:hypothetical protein TW95_gp0594 [Pandoravirus inopinatum]|uniref:Uncharacterized protein n=1 Tax=Pandoravirus inopinatum TaxID=1605721 RepID=A0A0B5IX65_9VIRU|nr:hypothetical protein TW95_gp0594 [Pandoravirus inopinatum]AJF97328.1 hypothetical protein [Pandoravirus inopinatum]